MIVAAGLGTRLHPLTTLRPKPAVPVRGLPLIAYNLALLAAAGVDEVVVNVHHLPELLREAAERSCPPGLALHFSHERALLHTGGGIRRVADFLRESDPCVLLGGDMIVDLDLAGLVARHRRSGRSVSMALLDDPRARDFGSIGLDARGRVARIGGVALADPGAEAHAGLYTWVNVLSPAAFDTLPDRERFNHLYDWWGPQRAAGDPGIGGEVLGADACRWQSVGTPAEYLDANFAPLSPSYLDVDARARALGTRIEPHCIVGRGARIEPGARLSRVVVWEDECVPGDAQLTGGVFAGGAFLPCEEAGPS